MQQSTATGGGGKRRLATHAVVGAAAARADGRAGGKGRKADGRAAGRANGRPAPWADVLRWSVLIRMQGKGGERSTSLAEQPPEEMSPPYPARSLILPIEEVPYQVSP